MSIRQGDNIIAGASGAGTPDGITLVTTQDGILHAEGVLDKNKRTPKFDWMGTLQEYTTQNIEETHPEWVCYITDDIEGGSSVYTKEEVDNLISGTLKPAVNTNITTNILSPFCVNSGVRNQDGTSRLLTHTQNTITINADTVSPAILVNANGDVKEIKFSKEYTIDYTSSVKDTPYTRPLLTANGTAGGDKFACFADTEETGSGRYAYKAFDKDTGYGFNESWASSTAGGEHWIAWYTPNPTKIDSITIRNSSSDHNSYAFVNGRIEYSNDNVTWEIEQNNLVSSNTGNGAYVTFKIDKPVFSKYKRLVCTKSNYATYVLISNIQLNNAIQKVSSSSIDGNGYIFYDFDLDKMKIFQHFIQSDTQPLTPQNNTIWFNTSKKKYESFAYINNDWFEINACYLGKSVVDVSTIKSIENTPYSYIREWGNNNPVSIVNPSVVINSYINGTSGYRIWSDGYCEQWGIIYYKQRRNYVTLLKKYGNTNYSIQLTTGTNADSNGYETLIRNQEQKIDSFSLDATSGVTAREYKYFWQTKGYLAEGEY